MKFIGNVIAKSKFDERKKKLLDTTSSELKTKNTKVLKLNKKDYME